MELVYVAVPPPSVDVTGLLGALFFSFFFFLGALFLHLHKQGTGPFAKAVFEGELQCTLTATVRQDPPNQRQRQRPLLRL